MSELAALTLIFFVIFNHFSNRKEKHRKPRGFEAEVKEIFDRADYESSAAREITGFLYDLINDGEKNLERFTDSRINQAQRILDNTGPVAFYWMTDIAAQLATLSAAQVNGIPTNINFEVGESVTPEAIVEAVIRD
jgi:hypothetical protein